MTDCFRPWPMLRRGLLALPLLALLTPAAQAQCPIANFCTPGAATDPDTAIFGRGITRVQLNTLDRRTRINDGYQDYSCVTGGSTTLLVGNAYPITVTTATGIPEAVRVWVDFDNNGIFNATAELVFSSTANGAHTGTLTVPATAVLNAPLRMRVAADDASEPVPTPCSTPTYSQTEDYAVTIQANTAPPVAAFTAGADTVTCSGLVQFTDQSSGALATWLWSFGDGTTSTQQNPQHQYTTAGVYTVQLIVTNANGSDTLTRTNYIRYDSQVPVAASCTPQTVAACCNYGIGRVRLATLDRTSGDASEGYRDFTCGVRASVVGGNRYQLIVDPTGTLAQDIRAWLDFNNDGIFTANELLLTALGQTDSAAASVTIPLTAPLNTPLRLRVMADAVNLSSGPCAAPQRGQVEDYTVIVRANTLPPAAAFTVATSTPCDSTKTFTDESQNAPTSWLWYFGDGTTSTLQNPTHTYTQSGAFTVSLVVTNAFGTDSSAQVGAALVTIPCMNYCVPTNLQTQSVWISRVRMAQIDRTSGLDPNAYVVTFSPTAQLTVGQGDSLVVTTTITAGGPPNFSTTAWIDFNRNSTWEANEIVLQQQGDRNNPTVGELVTVPATAQAGPTMMRVLTTRNPQFANNPCPNGAGAIELEDYQVNISANQAPPTANFFTADSVSCNGLVQFTDRSENVPTSWSWNFGDGSPVSTAQNPQHQYLTTPGTYTVTLAVANAFGTDTMISVAAVRVTGDPVPGAPGCRPQTTTPSFGVGIDSVRVRALGRELVNSTPDETDGYRDYTCTKRGVVYRGRTVTLRVTAIRAMGPRMSAWIDYNNDGDFALGAERVLNATGIVNQATFTVPATAPLNVPLRLRVASEFIQGGGQLQPCGTNGQLQFGQVEDYTLIVRDTILARDAEQQPLALSLAPNPTVDGRVLVRLSGEAALPGADATLTLTVRSVLGQQVLRRTLTVRPGRETEVDLSALPRGVYVVQTDGPAAALRGTMRLIRD